MISDKDLKLVKKYEELAFYHSRKIDSGWVRQASKDDYHECSSLKDMNKNKHNSTLERDRDSGFKLLAIHTPLLAF